MKKGTKKSKNYFNNLLLNFFINWKYLGTFLTYVHNYKVMNTLNEGQDSYKGD